MGSYVEIIIQDDGGYMYGILLLVDYFILYMYALRLQKILLTSSVTIFV